MPSTNTLFRTSLSSSTAWFWRYLLPPLALSYNSFAYTLPLSFGGFLSLGTQQSRPSIKYIPLLHNQETLASQAVNLYIYLLP